MSPILSSRLAIVCLLGAALSAAGCDRGSPANGQAQANVATSDEVSPDEAAPAGNAAAAPRAGAVDRSHKGEAAPDAAFTAPDGKHATLAQFRGKPVLLNLWATWCAPCVKELPTLDAAAAGFTGGLRLVAVSQDMDAGKAKAFLAQRHFAHVAAYTDAKMALSLAYGANLPTTILYDSNGRELWRVAGDMDWTGATAKALLAEAR